MNEIFNDAEWIWIRNDVKINSYAEFFSSFKYCGGNIKIAISCDSDYVLFLNGKFVSSNQYGCYDHYKIYDAIDLTDYAVIGENKLAVLVWYFGEDSMRYKRGKAGLIFKVFSDDVILLKSDENVLSRESLCYKNGNKKKITAQIGFSFSFDANLLDDWINGGGENFSRSMVVDKNCEFYPRPIKFLKLNKAVDGKIISNKNNRSFIIDLGAETVGLLSFEFNSSSKQKVLICWGEHLDDGSVRRIIGSRDFSVEYIATDSKNAYVNYLLRFGARYLQFEFENEVTDLKVSLTPQNYPVEKVSVSYSSDVVKEVYDVCVRTLELCMMEHYVDCPWREQCLYAFDSRNQMLCGYYAFKNGNKDYARANLKLMAMDRRSDGLMSICYPCGTDLTIPSFSLYYVLAVSEYVEHTDDLSLFEEVYGKIKEILTTFGNNASDGLVCKFGGRNHWNFYDWSKFGEGTLMTAEEPAPDFLINALFVVALDRFSELCKLSGLPFDFEAVRNAIKKIASERFFIKEKGLFSLDGSEEKCTELVNSFAVFSGIADDEQKAKILETLASNLLEPCSLSMKFFKYEVLTDSGVERYNNYVLNEIEKDYKHMLNSGATSVWETEVGADAFDKAGSLCHGWSAVPIYFYHKLKSVNKIS